MSREETQYPEHEKLDGIRELSQALGGVLDWMLNEKGWKIAEYVEDVHHKSLFPVHVNITTVLAEYYKIDLGKLEDEKLQMLDEIGKMNEK